jgi:hypothetical protein
MSPDKRSKDGARSNSARGPSPSLAKKAYRGAEEACVTIPPYNHEGNDRPGSVGTRRSRKATNRGFDESERLAASPTEGPYYFLKTTEPESVAV